MKTLMFAVAVLTLFVTLASRAQQDIEVTVGIMSPLTGGSMTTGKKHNFWAGIALDRAKRFRVGNQFVTIVAKEIDTLSKDADTYCRDQALQEANQNQLAAIIGPVRSGCVASVLSGNPEIPIVSTLASATSLTEQRNPWFFRANIHDKQRMLELWRFIHNQGVDDVEHWFVLHDQSKYGLGLKKDLSTLFDSNMQVHYLSIPEQSHVPVFNDLDSSLLPASGQRAIFFTLGDSQPVLRAINQISAQAKTHDFQAEIYTVGENQELLHTNSDHLITIGEMQFKGNQSARLSGELDKVKQLIEKTELSFLHTTYQASRFIIPQAIKRAMEALPTDYSIQELREQIRVELEQGRFDSLQPPDRVEFIDGNMQGEFVYPIKQVSAVFKQLNGETYNTGWVEFEQNKLNVNFLESPITVSMLLHNLESESLKLLLFDDQELVTEKQLTLENSHRAQAKFHVTSPGNYQIKTTSTDSYPESLPVKVSVSPFYLVCLIAAWIGVFLKQRMADISWGLRLELLLEGGITGLAVGFASTYVQYSIIPMTSLSWNVVNGLLYGFIGGWFGPMIVSSLTNRILPSGR